MKKLFTIAIFAIMILSANQVLAQGSEEQAATDVINAYKNKDIALLKKYATGMMVYVINDSFFESDDAKPLVEIAEKWDGTIREIRYSKGDMMGKTILLASVYFSDNDNGNLNTVLLSSYENSEWKAFVYGISDIPRSEFEQGSKELSGAGSTEETKPAESPEETKSTKSDRSAFSIEMANGDIYEKPSTEKLKELLKSLNDDNFFLILNCKEGFLQTTTSEKGYIVQYSDDSGMFEAEDYFTFEMLVDIFVAYIDNDNTWKSKAKWGEM
ncbi:MAG: hypothetical protein K8R31_06290 [Bacteroidales bacterium]|nr:hypothetical protein [Bacteroidales bacterium]